MVDKLTCYVATAFAFIVAGVALHVVGVVTDHWFSTDRDSPMGKREDQFLMLAIAVANMLLCGAVLIRSFNICVGIVAFITISLMLVVVAQSYEITDAAMVTVQERYPDWPTLKLWWSFYVTFGGIILNTAATIVFLILLLIKGGKNDYKETRGLAAFAVTPPNGKSQICTISSKKDLLYEEVPEKLADTSYAGPSINYVYETNATECVAPEKLADTSYAGPSINYVYETNATECVVDFARPLKRAEPAAFDTKSVEYVEFEDNVKQTEPVVQMIFAKTYSERL